MSAPGTPKASQAAITAVQEAMKTHRIHHGGWTHVTCTCGENFALDDWYDHRAVAAADAAAPHNAADALKNAARELSHAKDCHPDDGDPYVGCNCRLSLIWARADRIEAGHDAR